MTAEPPAAPLRAGLVVVALVVIGALGAAQTVTDAWMQDHHSLARNGRWAVGKQALRPPPAGAAAMATTSVPLRFDKLNVGAWSGYQEVLLREPLDLLRLRAGVELGADHCVHLVWGATDQGSSGARISTQRRLPSIVWTADADGVFLQTTPWTTGVGPGWSTVMVEVEPTGAWTLSVNDDDVLRGGGPAAVGRVGLRGCLDAVWVDDIRVRARDRELVSEDWSPRGRQQVFATALGLLLAAALALALAIRAFTTRITVIALLLAGLLGAVGAASTAWRILDARQWGHPIEEADPDRPRAPAPHAVTDALNARHPRGVDAPRVLFVGTDQTAGVGDRAAGGGFVARTCALLPPGPAGPWECLNGGLIGSDAAELFKLTRDQWVHHGPAAIVVTLGAQEAGLSGYERSLVRFAELAASRGAILVLATQPTSPEAGAGFRQDRHDVTRAVAVDRGVPLVDLQERLFARRDDGLLWWDLGTLSAAGHQIAAEELAATLGPLLAQPSAQNP